MMVHLLDNPIWNALTSAHSHFAEGDELARTYPLSVSPLAGIVSQSEPAYQSLFQCTQPNKRVALFLHQPVEAPDIWQVEMAFPLSQMVCDTLQPVSSDVQIETLSEDDIPEMLALTALTKPGPFKQDTYKLGAYFGIRQHGRLAAMAGERLHITGYREVSAVCTHPDFRGHGYAKLLVSKVSQHIASRGEIPFLHVKPDNASAIKVYEQLGFYYRRDIHLGILTQAKAAEVRTEAHQF